MMPKMDGFAVARRLKDSTETSHIPIVMVTALGDVQDRIRALEAGADDFLTKPVDPTELKARVQSLLKVKAYNDYMRHYQKELESAVAKKTESLWEALHNIKAASLDTIHRLSRAAEYKDEDTGDHIQRVSHYAAAVARQMGQPDNFIEMLLYAVPMHDVGKIGIPTVSFSSQANWIRTNGISCRLTQQSARRFFPVRTVNCCRWLRPLP